MISEWELWACAYQIVRDHGADAPRYAAERCAMLDASADCDGARTWRAIANRVHQMSRERSPGEVLQ